MAETVRHSEHSASIEVLLGEWHSLGRQLVGVRTPLLAALFCCALLVGGSMTAGRVAGIDLSDLTRDRAAVVGTRVLAGAVSQFGVMLWASGAALCFLGASLVSLPGHNRAWRGFFLSAGLLTTLLCFDDQYMFHESLFPRFLHVEESGTYVAYIILTLWFLYYHRKKILATEYIVLIIAFLLFSVSVAADQFLEFSDIETFVEDMFKLTGIIFWILYFGRTVLQQATALDKPVSLVIGREGP